MKFLFNIYKVEIYRFVVSNINYKNQICGQICDIVIYIKVKSMVRSVVN
jgi:hypothetical protein